MEVFRLEVYLVTDFEVRSWTPFCVCWPLVAFLGFQHLQSEESVKFVQVCDVGLGGGGGEVAIGVDGEVGVIALIGKEGGYARGSTRCVVVGEFRERKEFRPIVLLVVAVDPKVLLECLVGMLGLTIPLGVITGGEMQAHVQSFS